MLGHRLVVVSDAHLGRGPSDAKEAFLAFLQAVPTLGDSLLVAGDLFEFWYSYRRVVPRDGFAVAAALQQLGKAIPVAMVGGNHDRWGGSFWERELGIRFEPKTLRFQVGDRAGVAIHGDGVTETHWSAKLLHRVISSRATIAGFGALHPDVGHWLVDRLSGHLGDTTRDPELIARSAERQRVWAEALLAADPTLAFVVMGHTHQPAVSQPSAGRFYVNPGPWCDGRHYAIVEPRLVTLHRFTS